MFHVGKLKAIIVAILAAEEAKLYAALARVGRNDLCPWGSGKKVKLCHGRSKSKAISRKPLPKPQRRASVVFHKRE